MPSLNRAARPTPAAEPRHIAGDRFRPDVEGLRAVAVSLVALNHAGVPFLAGGFVGVDVFFVLSGFLITSLLLRDAEAHNGPPSIRSFYARRVRRLLPAATLVILATVIWSYASLGFIRGDQVANDARWVSAFGGNLSFALVGTDYLRSQDLPSPLLHFWSLGVEEQFYAVWPWVFVFIAARWQGVRLRSILTAALAAIFVASAVWSYLQTGSNATWAYFSPLTRGWELAAGALLAVGISTIRRLPPRYGAAATWVGLGGLLGSAILIDRHTPFPGTAALLPVLSTCLAIAGGTSQHPFGAQLVLGTVPFQSLGRLSYSFYLWHWPLLVIPAELQGAPLSLLSSLLLVGVALLFSAITYVIVERPVRFSRFLSSRPMTSIALGATLVVSSISFASWAVIHHGRL